MNPRTELQQKVLQKYGFGNRFGKRDDDGRWFVEVQVALDEAPMLFVSECTSDDDGKEGTKEGLTAVSQLALEGLARLRAEWDAKPRQELTEVFPDWIPIRDSSESRCWASFWKHKPSVVGIDTEGNHKKGAPVLVQIAVEDGDFTYCILDVPQNDRISKNMKRLLQDDSITKVFCDNYAHFDKKSLGIPVEKDHDWTSGSIVDIESVAARRLGPVKVARGVGRIVTLVMPELNVVIEKPRQVKGNMKSRMQRIGRFALIEQGKLPPLKGVKELKREEKHYAALDALATLRAYRRLIAEKKHEVNGGALLDYELCVSGIEVVEST